MFSFGMEKSRAFWIAVASALFAEGSPPPSFAATMIARESFENMTPRFLSVAAFLCLIVDHLEWPDMVLPGRSGERGDRSGSHGAPGAHALQEAAVQPVVARQLRV